MDQSPFARPISTASAAGGERFSQAPTVVVDAALDSQSAVAAPRNSAYAAAAATAAGDDLKPPTALANRNSAGFGDGSSANLPYRNSVAPTVTGSAPHLGDSDKEAAAAASDAPRGTSPFPDLGQSEQQDESKNKRKRLLFILGGVAALAIVAAAVAVPVAITQTKKSSSASATSPEPTSSSDDTGSGQTEPPAPVPTSAVTGGDGSIITTEKGTTFTYVNKFGGTWYDDPTDPYNNNAQAQSTSPPLSQEFDYQNDPMRGVNLGGWLVPEPFIVPALFEPYVDATPRVRDEYTLSQAMAADTANGGLDQLERHYDTFITEEDFAQIAGAGLNWIRLPIPFWVVEKYPDEPFLEKVAWKYVLKAFKWARKYGLRIKLDLHTVPGSQNGFNHSGKLGDINFLYGPMGLANAQRTLDILRVITEFISQPEYVRVVPMFGIMNEPVAMTIGVEQMTSFYLQAHDVIRNVTGTGAGNGPYIAVHDSFRGLASWADLLPGHDRMVLDVHPYLIFNSVDRAPLSEQLNKPCDQWASGMNTSWSNFGISVAGEFSLAINDCGLWLNGVGSGTRWEGTFGGGDGGAGDCSEWNDYANWTQDRKDDFRTFAMRNFDALGHYFFWTWKIGASSVTGKIETPMWSYSLGLREGWIPEDPSEAIGACGGTNPATPLTSEMIGGAGAGQISASVRAANPWPPTSINPGLSPDNVPVYTATGAIPTLAAPTPTTGSVDGWFNDADTMPIYTPIAGCTYPDAWDSVGASNPGPCSGGSFTAETTTSAEIAEETETTSTAEVAEETETTDILDEEARRIRRVRKVIPRPRRTPAP